MSAIRRRVQQIERAHQRKGSGPAIVVTLADGTRLVNGESMSQADFERRWPGCEPDVSLTIGGVDLAVDI